MLPPSDNDSTTQLGDLENWLEESSKQVPTSSRQQALDFSVGRLLQSLLREGFLSPHGAKQVGVGASVKFWLTEGRRIEAEILVLPFSRFELKSWGLSARAQSREPEPLRFLQTLESDLRSTFSQAQWQKLRDSFVSSYIGVLLAMAVRDPDCPAPEQNWLGHNLFPFPRLCLGPAIPDRARVCNTLGRGIEIPLLRVAKSRAILQVSIPGRNLGGSAFERIGEDGGSRALPLHPWNVRGSTAVAALLQDRKATIEYDRNCVAYTLASSRTFRCGRSGFEVKLSTGCQLTSERRQIPQMYFQNAPVIGDFVTKLEGRAEWPEALRVQRDVGYFCIADRHLAPAISGIVREPLPEEYGSIIVPALDLWYGPRTAENIRLDYRNPLDLWEDYCWVVLSGPLELFYRYGMAVEPHLQNSLIGIQEGRFRFLVIRDLDGAGLDQRNFSQNAGSRLSRRLSPLTWRYMIEVSSGFYRLKHALLDCHLGEAFCYLQGRYGCDPGEMMAILWSIARQLQPRVEHSPWRLFESRNIGKALLEPSLKPAAKQGLTFRPLFRLSLP